MGALLKNPHLQLSRGIYILPNLLTTGSLFAAFYAIVAGMKHHFVTAVIAIFIGMIADALDGRVARMTHTQTAFGAEYDSLSDLVTSGLAPSLLAYTWGLAHFGKIGWLIAFVYTASVALRLARFNTQLGVADKRYFQGLACPAGAGIVASFIWVGQYYELTGIYFRVFLAILMVFIAILMVSKIRYYSFKDIDFKGKVSFLHALLTVLLFVAIAVNPSVMLLISFSLYSLSGPTHTLMQLHRVRRSKRRGENIP